MIDSLTRGLCLVGLAILAPVRRGITAVEGRLARTEYRLRARTGALFVVLAVATACAPWQARRAIARIDARCERAYSVATTEAEVQSIHARCDAAYEEVRRGR